MADATLVRRRFRRLLVAVIGAASVASIVGASQFHHVRRVNFMGDESGWISSSGYYTQLILVGDFSHESWEGASLGNWGSINPPLGKLVLGASVRLHPEYEPGDSEFRGIYRFSQPFEWNASRGNVPLEGTVIRAREVTALYFTASLVLLYFAVLRYTNLMSALAAVLIVLTNSWIVNETIPVLTDPYYFCLMFALFGLGGWMVESRTMRSKLLSFGLAGLIGGSACLIKINGLPFGCAFAGTLVAYKWAVRRPIEIRSDLTGLTVFVVCALVVVYALNPYFWPTESWRSVLEFPRLYTRWPELFALQREQMPWPESGRTIEILRVLLGEFTVHPIELALFGAGLAYLVFGLWRSLARKHVDVKLVPLFFFLTHFGFLVALMPVNYRRYYLLAVISAKVIEAIGFTYAMLIGWSLTWRFARAVIRRIRSRNATQTQTRPHEQING